MYAYGFRLTPNIKIAFSAIARNYTSPRKTAGKRTKIYRINVSFDSITKHCHEYLDKNILEGFPYMEERSLIEITRQRTSQTRRTKFLTSYEANSSLTIKTLFPLSKHRHENCHFLQRHNTQFPFPPVRIPDFCEKSLQPKRVSSSS